MYVSYVTREGRGARRGPAGRAGPIFQRWTGVRTDLITQLLSMRWFVTVPSAMTDGTVGLSTRHSESSSTRVAGVGSGAGTHACARGL